MTSQLLKLIAKDSDDIQVVSAILQDAIAPVCDMAFQETEKNFVMVVHRLRREAVGDPAQPDAGLGLERICCAVNLHGVDKAQLQGVTLTDQGQMLDLLAILLEDSALTFIFAAGAKIRLQLQDWSMLIEDFGEAWPAQCKPCHETDGSEQGAANRKAL